MNEYVTIERLLIVAHHQRLALESTLEAIQAAMSAAECRRCVRELRDEGKATDAEFQKRRKANPGTRSGSRVRRQP